MLNNPDKSRAHAPEAESTGSNEGGPLRQIGVIGVVGLYLFGLVWLYVKIPWFALGAFAVAGAMVVAGLIGQLRRDAKPPPRF